MPTNGRPFSVPRRVFLLFHHVFQPNHRNQGQRTKSAYRGNDSVRCPKILHQQTLIRVIGCSILAKTLISLSNAAIEPGSFTVSSFARGANTSSTHVVGSFRYVWKAHNTLRLPVLTLTRDRRELVASSNSRKKIPGTQVYYCGTFMPTTTRSTSVAYQRLWPMHECMPLRTSTA